MLSVEIPQYWKPDYTDLAISIYVLMFAGLNIRVRTKADFIENISFSLGELSDGRWTWFLVVTPHLKDFFTSEAGWRILQLGEQHLEVALGAVDWVNPLWVAHWVSEVSHLFVGFTDKMNVQIPRWGENDSGNPNFKKIHAERCCILFVGTNVNPLFVSEEKVEANKSGSWNNTPFQMISTCMETLCLNNNQ